MIELCVFFGLYLGGVDITETLFKILNEERGLSLRTTADFEIIREIKVISFIQYNSIKMKQNVNVIRRIQKEW
jgi:hypothetical protein